MAHGFLPFCARLGVDCPWYGGGDQWVFAVVGLSRPAKSDWRSLVGAALIDHLADSCEDRTLCALGGSCRWAFVESLRTRCGEAVGRHAVTFTLWAFTLCSL